MNKTFVLAVLAAILATMPAANAADRPAALRYARPLRPGVAAFPRLAARRGDKAAARINRLLKEANRSAPTAIACKDFRRSVRITMRGPHYLSLAASADWYCGAYPATSRTVLVYDLATGRPADWKTILTPALIDKVVPATGGDESDPVTIESSKLWSLYLNEARPMNKDCADVYAAPTPLGRRLKVWPDAKADGLGLQASGWPHVVQACAVEVVVPVPALRKLGVQAAFLHAVDVAHHRGWYDK